MFQVVVVRLNWVEEGGSQDYTQLSMHKTYCFPRSQSLSVKYAWVLVWLDIKSLVWRTEAHILIIHSSGKLKSLHFLHVIKQFKLTTPSNYSVPTDLLLQPCRFCYCEPSLIIINQFIARPPPIIYFILFSKKIQ